MSDAPRFTASVSRPLISFTTGASSARSCALTSWSTSSAPTSRASAALVSLRSVCRRFDVLEQRLQLRVGLLVVLLDRVAERVLPRDHWEYVAAGDELDVLDRRDVVRVRDRHREGPPLALE